MVDSVLRSRLVGFRRVRAHGIWGFGQMEFPAGMAARPRVSALRDAPTTRASRPLLVPVETLTSSREGNGDPSAGRSVALTTAETDRMLADVLARHTQSAAAVGAFDDLNHALLLSRAKRQAVPCVGPGAEAWTSADPVDQALAADLCLLCPVFALCQRYADEAEPTAGTWAGVTRDRGRQLSGTENARQKRASRARVDPEAVRLNLGPDCGCGCGYRTKRGRYLPGHDTRHLATLVRGVRDEVLTADAALAEVGHSEKLQAKLAARLGL